MKRKRNMHNAFFFFFSQTTNNINPYVLFDAYRHKINYAGRIEKETHFHKMKNWSKWTVSECAEGLEKQRI